MKILPIYTYNAGILRQKTRKITNVNDDIIELVQDMFHTMHNANGIGLAAPQIGKDISLTVVDISKVEGEEKQKPIVLLNPRITDYHGSTIIEEGCLSFPLLRMEVERPEKVFLTYDDLDLNEKKIELNGLMSRVTQHEIDHLNGILFIDRIPKQKRKMLKERLDQIRRGELTVSYALAELQSEPKKSKRKVKLM
jgi:peptide deformylase